jgi:hypothetical protein
MIAIQLAALKVDGKIMLHFTKVLDVYESPDGPEDQAAAGVDRRYWETRSSPAAMQIFDSLIKILSDHSVQVKLNWRQDGIALAGKWNFARITPRKTGHCLLRIFDRLPEEVIKEAKQKLEDAGAAIQPLTGNRLSVRLDAQILDRIAPVLVPLIKQGVEPEGE